MLISLTSLNLKLYLIQIFNYKINSFIKDILWFHSSFSKKKSTSFYLSLVEIIFRWDDAELTEENRIWCLCVSGCVGTERVRDNKVVKRQPKPLPIFRVKPGETHDDMTSEILYPCTGAEVIEYRCTSKWTLCLLLWFQRGLLTVEEYPFKYLPIRESVRRDRGRTYMPFSSSLMPILLTFPYCHLYPRIWKDN